MTVNLICLPFAGAGASFFWPWRKLAAERMTVCPIQLPGRERLVEVEPFRDAHKAVDALLPEVAGEAHRSAGPVVLFGHSLGAVLAYELTRRLLDGGVPVRGLLVSGSPVPSAGRDQRATGLSDEEFLTRVESFAGYRHPAFDDPEARELLLPTLRADVEMHENYRPRTDTAIAVGITALRGADDELVSAEQLSEWAALTTAGFRLVELPGGHMYLVDSGRAVLGVAAEIGRM